MLRCPLCFFMNGCSSAGKYMLGIPKNSDSILGISRKDKEALLSVNHCQQYCARWTNGLNHKLLMFLCSPHPTPPSLPELLFIVVNFSFWKWFWWKLVAYAFNKKIIQQALVANWNSEHELQVTHPHPQISLPWFEFCKHWIRFVKYGLCGEKSKFATALSLRPVMPSFSTTLKIVWHVQY